MLITHFLAPFEQYLSSKQRSKETIRGYLNDLRQLDRYLSGKYNLPTYLEDLTAEDIEDYLSMLKDEKGYAVASVNRNLNSIRAMCQFAYRKGWVLSDVSKDVESLKREQKERTYLTETEIETLIEAVEHPLIQLAVRTMAYTGLRVSECVHLNLEDVDLTNELIYVIEGKGKKDRTVPIAKSLSPYLIDYLFHWRVDTSSKRFFATKKTGELSQQYINRVLHETTKRLGWRKKVTCHILRHSFASLLVSKNADVTKISRILGHSDLKTTMIYVHSSPKEMREVVNLLS